MFRNTIAKDRGGEYFKGKTKKLLLCYFIRKQVSKKILWMKTLNFTFFIYEREKGFSTSWGEGSIKKFRKGFIDHPRKKNKHERNNFLL